MSEPARQALPKGYISPNQLNTWLNCGVQYEAHYIYKLPYTGSSPSLVFGSAFDEAVNLYYGKKVANEAFPFETVKEKFAVVVEERGKEVEFWGDDSMGGLKDQGVKMLDKYVAEVAPQIEATAVQVKRELAVKGRPFTLLSITDIESATTIYEHKTAGKSPSASDLVPDKYRLQVTVQKIANPSKSVTIVYAIRNKEPKFMLVPVKVTMEDARYLSGVTALFTDAVGRRVFVPNRRYMMCSKSSCSFWKFCVEKYGGTVKDGKKA
ncbi:MAG: PD-(D/E)XK nuclease family protein [Bacteroidetes bacterium]|nr:PD-(D/E)XK nuclease family protein [Bacteroidota bacterium]